MAITVEFLSLPIIVKLVGGKSISMEFSGQTLEELVHQVAEKYGEKVRQFLLDETGHLDGIFRVLCNRQEWIGPEQMGRPLQDGDRVTIMMLVAGG